jgi:hypothetical protein
MPEQSHRQILVVPPSHDAPGYGRVIAGHQRAIEAAPRSANTQPS